MVLQILVSMRFTVVKLKNINIPNGVKSIKESTFNGCKSLINITIPEKVTNIGDYAFTDCKSLVSLVIPNSVKKSVTEPLKIARL